MNRPSDDNEVSKSIESSIPSYVTMPGSLSYFAIAYEQWDQLKSQITRISASESLWFSASLAFLTFSVSFFISIILPGSVELWVETSLWVAAIAGIVGAFVCGIAYWEDRRRRMSDIKAILNYMDEIEPVKPENQNGLVHPVPYPSCPSDVRSR